MSTSAVQDFAKYLAGIKDADRRESAIKQAKLLAVQSAPEESFEPPIRTLGDYLAAEIEIPPVLVHPYLMVRGGVNATIGKSGKGKTQVNLNRILRWASGKPMFDDWKTKDGESILYPSEGPMRVLIIENEGAAGLFHRQMGLMVNAEGYVTDDDRKLINENVLIWGEGGYSNLKLDDPNKLNEVRAGCEKWKPDLVFIEPFRSLWKGEENSSTEMNVVVDALIGIATDYNCAVQISHHERKGGTGEDGEKMSAARGSSVLEGAVTALENFESVKGNDFRELSWSKYRHGAAPAPVRMQWDATAWWYNLIPSDAIEDSLISALRDNPDAMTVKMLSEVVEEREPKIRSILNKLVKEGRVKKGSSQSDGRGSTGNTYRLPSSDGDEGFGGLSI